MKGEIPKAAATRRTRDSVVLERTEVESKCCREVHCQCSINPALVALVNHANTGFDKRSEMGKSIPFLGAFPKDWVSSSRVG